MTKDQSTNNKKTELDNNHIDRVLKLLEKLLYSILGSSGLIIGFSLLNKQNFSIDTIYGIIVLVISGIIIMILMIVYTFPSDFGEIQKIDASAKWGIIFSIVLYFTAIIYFISAFTGIKSADLS